MLKIDERISSAGVMPNPEQQPTRSERSWSRTLLWLIGLNFCIYRTPGSMIKILTGDDSEHISYVIYGTKLEIQTLLLALGWYVAICNDYYNKESQIFGEIQQIPFPRDPRSNDLRIRLERIERHIGKNITNDAEAKNYREKEIAKLAFCFSIGLRMDATDRLMGLADADFWREIEAAMEMAENEEELWSLLK